jgi:PIN domain nuclease of toxin-antitoxin system
MRLLLDTHALIWWLLDAERLPRKVHEAIEDKDNEVFVSPVNAYEMALKFRLGKLDFVGPVLTDYLAWLERMGLRDLPITTAHALRAGGLEIDHRDPFDRLLIAQALTEQLTLVSNEELFDRAAVSRLWG